MSPLGSLLAALSRGSHRAKGVTLTLTDRFSRFVHPSQRGPLPHVLQPEGVRRNAVALAPSSQLSDRRRSLRQLQTLKSSTLMPERKAAQQRCREISRHSPVRPARVCRGLLLTATPLREGKA